MTKEYLRSELELIVPWVDHEDILGGDCTERCPACRLARILEALLEAKT